MGFKVRKVNLKLGPVNRPSGGGEEGKSGKKGYQSREATLNQEGDQLTCSRTMVEKNDAGHIILKTEFECGKSKQKKEKGMNDLRRSTGGVSEPLTFE